MRYLDSDRMVIPVAGAGVTQEHWDGIFPPKITVARMDAVYKEAVIAANYEAPRTFYRQMLILDEILRADALFFNHSPEMSDVEYDQMHADRWNPPPFNPSGITLAFRPGTSTMCAVAHGCSGWFEVKPETIQEWADR